MYSRNQRAETRNRAKDELKRVINSVDKVRKWLVATVFVRKKMLVRVTRNLNFITHLYDRKKNG